MTIIMSTALVAQVRLSIDMAGTLAAEATGVSVPDEDSKLGITLGYDHVLGSASGMDFGAGLEYQLNRDIDVENGGKFGFTSILGFGNYNISESMYAGLRVGYAIMFTMKDKDGNEIEGVDFKGGIMYGLGGGYNINDKMAVEVSYNSNAGTMEATVGGSSIDIGYTRLRISFLYSL